MNVNLGGNLKLPPKLKMILVQFDLLKHFL